MVGFFINCGNALRSMMHKLISFRFESMKSMKSIDFIDFIDFIDSELDFYRG